MMGDGKGWGHRGFVAAAPRGLVCCDCRERLRNAAGIPRHRNGHSRRVRVIVGAAADGGLGTRPCSTVRGGSIPFLAPACWQPLRRAAGDARRPELIHGATGRQGQGQGQGQGCGGPPRGRVHTCTPPHQDVDPGTPIRAVSQPTPPPPTHADLTRQPTDQPDPEPRPP